MGDPIKQPDNIGRVLPLSPARESGKRRQPQQRPDPGAARQKRDAPNRDDGARHQVDEYV